VTSVKLNLLLLAVLAAGTVAIASCATDVQIPEKVTVEVPVACVKPEDVPARPQIRSESDLMNMPRGLRTIAAWSDKVKLEAYAAELAAIVTGCSRIPQRPP
jgi:hypothetical protein